jgi:diguanylate cyclase (GGDEF)-like protein
MNRIPHPIDEPAFLEDSELENIALSIEKNDSHLLSEPLSHHGEQVYTEAIWNLAHILYEPARAREICKLLVSHRLHLKEQLGRDVGLRVAAIDYFVNIARELGSPRIINPELLTQLREQATRDPLTGLGNRRVYRERVMAELARSKRYGSEFLIAVFDLDNFKQVNDQKGHAVGDHLLQATAEILIHSTRQTDLVARWGGEEFVVLMPQTHLTGGLEVAQRIRKAVESEFAKDGVTISGGIACFPANGEDERTLFGYADRALYRAKAEGKNRIATEPKERRRFARAEESFAVRVVATEASHEVEGSTSNIGEGGFSFSTTSPPPISSQVVGNVEMHGWPKKFTGRVVYVEESKKGTYEVGIQFLSTPPAEK